MTSKQNIEIEITSDIMCPWCWVGKRKLEKAMEQSKDQYNFKVTWHPFLLRPNMPEDGVEKPDGYGAHTSGSRLVEVGKTVGIDFTYKCNRFPNTVVAHTALDYALQKDPSGKIQNKLQEALFQAYFTDGNYPDVLNVTRLAAEAGLPENEVKNYITKKENQQRIRSLAAESSSKGVSGVPSFSFNGKTMFSGAQDPSAFIHSFKVAVEKFPLKAKAAM